MKRPAPPMLKLSAGGVDFVLIPDPDVAEAGSTAGRSERGTVLFDPYQDPDAILLHLRSFTGTLRVIACHNDDDDDNDGKPSASRTSANPISVNVIASPSSLSATTTAPAASFASVAPTPMATTAAKQALDTMMTPAGTSYTQARTRKTRKAKTNAQISTNNSSEESESEEEKPMESETEEEEVDHDKEMEVDKKDEDEKEEKHHKKKKKRAAPEPNESSRLKPKRRYRKRTASLTPEVCKPVDHAAFVIEGRGTKLKDLPAVKKSIDSQTLASTDILAAHRLLFATKGRPPKKTLKSNLLNFSGFLPKLNEGQKEEDVQDEDEEVERKMSVRASKLTVQNLMDLCDFFAIDRQEKDDKWALIDVLLDFLGVPNETYLKGSAEEGSSNKESEKAERNLPDSAITTSKGEKSAKESMDEEEEERDGSENEEEEDEHQEDVEQVTMPYLSERKFCFPI